MAIYALHGLYAAGCLAMACPLHRFGLNPSFLANHKGAFTKGDIKGFVVMQAKKMELKKEVVVIPGDCECYHSFGNTWFSGMVGIKLAKSYEENITVFKITRELAHIKANDNLTFFGGVLAAALFTTVVLAVNRDLFTGYLGGLGAGIITSAVLARRAKRMADLTAMKYCSQDVNQAYLDRLKDAKKKDGGPCLLGRVFVPSLNERIRYFQAHMNATPRID